MTGGTAFLLLAAQFISEMDYSPEQIDAFSNPGAGIESGIEALYHQIDAAGEFASPAMVRAVAEGELALRNFAADYYTTHGTAPPNILWGEDQAALSAIQSEHMNNVLNARWDREGLLNHLNSYAEHWDIDFEDIPHEQYAEIAKTEDFGAIAPESLAVAKPELPDNGTDGLRITDILAAAAASCTYLACQQPVLDGYGGGAHGCMRLPVGDGLDSHHMPADSISPLPRDMGPAIRMSPRDHRQTSSWGSGSDAVDYRSEQLALAATGNISAAFQMDVEDLQRQGLLTKYARSVQQARAYMQCIIAASGGILR